MSLGGSKLVQPQRFREIVRITSAVAVQTVAHLHLSFIEALVCSLLPQSKSSVANVAILLRKNLAESKLTVTTVTLRCKAAHVLSLSLARESSGRGSRYGQVTLGRLYGMGVALDYAQALPLYLLAAAQGLDEAQLLLGSMYQYGPFAEDLAEALRLYQLAAVQAHPLAMYTVAVCHEFGWGVPNNKVEAIRWYRRAAAAGVTEAARHWLLQELGA